MKPIGMKLGLGLDRRGGKGKKRKVTKQKKIRVCKKENK